MQQPLNLHMISSRIKMLAESYEKYLKESASSVAGDVAVRAYSEVLAAKEYAEEIWKVGNMHEIKFKVVDEG